jgi:peptide/nickel transport system permease protein
MRTRLSERSFWSNLWSRKSQDMNKEDAYYAASHWRLMFRKMLKHRLARISLIVLSFMYVVALFGNFIAPQGLDSYDSVHINSRPSKMHWIDQQGKFHLVPFVYGLIRFGRYSLKIQHRCIRFNFSYKVRSIVF